MTQRGVKCLVTAGLAVCMLASAPLSYAAYGPAGTARDWCKKKTLTYLEKRGYAPYNWAATTYIEGVNYVTKGKWSVDADTINVECTTNKHGKKASGKYKILDVDILDDGSSADHANK
jgi:hypothetical protein